jgi:hypothetical protein
VYDSATNEWIPIGVGGHGHPDYITQATAVNPTIIDAKGDILTATAADTPARLAVGNNGETLVADSAATTGLRYQGSIAAGKNYIINGGMDIWQRGTTFSNITGYAADRMYCWNNANTTVSRQASDLTGFRYFLRYQRTASTSALDGLSVIYNMPTDDAIRFQGQTVTFSVYLRKGANLSGSVNLGIYYGTGTDQRYESYTGITLLISTTQTLTTSWARYSITATIPSNATEFCLGIFGSPAGTAGAADYYDVVGMQCELGSVATAFSRAGGNIQGELAACQRYYYRITGTNNFSNICPAYTDATNNAVTTLTFPVEMRVAPTSVDFSNIRVTNLSGASAVTSASVSSAFNGKNNTGINLGVAGTPFTAFAPFVVSCNNNAAGYLGMSAEL